MLFLFLLITAPLFADYLVPTQKQFYFESYFYIDHSANEEEIVNRINAQLRFLFSALKPHNMAPQIGGTFNTHWSEELVIILESNRKLKRVKYNYHGKVALYNDSARVIDIFLIADPFKENNTIMEKCSDGYSALLETLWYFLDLRRSQCQDLIAEDSDHVMLKNSYISEKEANRLFIPVKFFLYNELESPDMPHYEQFSETLVIYYISAPDISARLPTDRFFIEYIKFIHTLAAYYSNIYNNRNEHLLDIFFRNNSELLGEIKGKLLYWHFIIPHPLKVDKQVSVQLRTYFDDEIGNEEQFSFYLKEAYKRADIIIYNGHSHLGYGILNPEWYTLDDFSKKYQLMILNSCHSYSLFSAGYQSLFKNEKPIDIVVNTNVSAILNSGLVLADFLKELFLGHGFLTLLKTFQAKVSINSFPFVLRNF